MLSPGPNSYDVTRLGPTRPAARPAGRAAGEQGDKNGKRPFSRAPWVRAVKAGQVSRARRCGAGCSSRAPLPEVLLLVVCGTICDCEDYDLIAAWGKEHLAVLRLRRSVDADTLRLPRPV